VLPIDDVIPSIVQSLRRSPNVVIEAPPGAGKTTRVPPALLEFGPVLVLEPRRLAARMAARRVAEEMGEPLGETVGYQVRFETVVGPRTRLRFLTEGVLTRRLLADPDLRGVSTVVLDEFHERHLDGDLALALLFRLQRRRPEMRIVVMSATLDGEALSRYLNHCPVIRSEGRLHPVEVSYRPQSAAPLEEQVRDAVIETAPESDGHILVFLPGAAEIRRALDCCEGVARRFGLALYPLHGDLPAEEQDRAVLPCAGRKLILSTNVAESSLTIEGVSAVIDSGLARVARDSPWTGIASLDIARISKASAAQRAGRAGRTGPGRAIRLYPREDFVRRPDAEAPEIARRELSGLLLTLAAMGQDVDRLPWLEAPPEPAVRAARGLLDLLRAWPRAADLAALPVSPRLGVLLLEGGAGAAPVAAGLSLGENSGGVDVLEWTVAGLSPHARRLCDQLRRLAPDPAPLPVEQALLRAFPDRVARRRGDRELLLAGGGSAFLPAAASSLAGRPWLLAIDVEGRRERGLPLVRAASAIEPEWLLDHFPDRLTERSGVEWNRSAERVEAVSALLYGSLTIEESRSGAVDPTAAAALLATKAIESGVERFTDPASLTALLARCSFAASYADLPVPSVEDALRSACAGLRSFAELRQIDIPGLVLAQLSPVQRCLLDEIAPERLRLPGGRLARIHYEPGKPPWLASRLQDFFGMRESPRVGRGQVPVVLHLLAPNQRPVQTTTDLAGFWERLYPRLRRELGRRYPRHRWPEDPLRPEAETS